MDIEEILSLDDAASVISALKEKVVKIPEWYDLIKDYDQDLHEIVTDKTTRRDKTRQDGTVEKAARISLGLEKLLTRRMVEFMFAFPVKRTYYGIDGNETRQAIKNALEAIYTNARIDTENLKRGENYFASCEYFTVWYAVPKKNDLYGFSSNYKLKCKTYSPMDGTLLYPLFDEYGDMIAMSFEYTRTVKDEEVKFFETYTADKHIKWEYADSGWKNVTDDPIALMKIPGVYSFRRKPIYDGVTKLRSEIEYTLSRNSDTIAYNSAPILKIAGGVNGEEHKGESRRIYRVMAGGDVSYVSWAQSNEAVNNQIEKLLRFFWMQTQIPDVSFDNLRGIGGIGYDARQMYLTDVHLRVGDESGPFIEAFEREFNVLKEFLVMMNPVWKSEMPFVHATHTITPFIPNDEDAMITKLQKGNGGKPLFSQKDSIRMAGFSKNPEETYNDIMNERKVEIALEAAANPLAGIS